MSHKSCPCCGSEAKFTPIAPGSIYGHAVCQGCGLSTGESYAELGAWEAWDQRTTPHATSVLVAALTQAPAADDDPDTVDISLSSEDVAAFLDEWKSK